MAWFSETMTDKEFVTSLLAFRTKEPVWEECTSEEYLEKAWRFFETGVRYKCVPVWEQKGIMYQISHRPSSFRYFKQVGESEALVLNSETMKALAGRAERNGLSIDDYINKYR